MVNSESDSILNVLSDNMCHEAELTCISRDETVDLSQPVVGNTLEEIVTYRKSHHDNFILSHININSFRHKFPIIQALLLQGLCDFFTVSNLNCLQAQFLMSQNMSSTNRIKILMVVGYWYMCIVVFHTGEGQSLRLI